MAKVTGGLFSMEASGKFGGALVFGKWKGQQTVRQLVTPSNPKTAAQASNRNAVRVFGKIQKFIRTNTKIRTGQTKTDLALIKARAPSEQAWNGYLVASGIGPTGANYAATNTTYAALPAAQKTAWDTAAAALTPAITAVVQKGAGDAATPAMPAGQVFFQLVAALAIIGISAAPGAVPPTYA